MTLVNVLSVKMRKNGVGFSEGLWTRMNLPKHSLILSQLLNALMMQ